MFNYKNFIPIIEYNALVFYLFILVLELCVCAIPDNIFTCTDERRRSKYKVKYFTGCTRSKRQRSCCVFIFYWIHLKQNMYVTYK